MDGPTLRVFKIFLASPTAGMAAARDAVVEALLEVSKDSGLCDRVLIRLYRWEDKHRPVSLSLVGGGQTDIGQQLLEPEEADLVIGLFGHHLGNVLDPSLPIHPDDPTRTFGWSDEASQRRWHCAEWEVAQAKKAWVYFDGRDAPRAESPSCAAVLAYEHRLKAKGGMVNTYASELELKALVQEATRGLLVRQQVQAVPAAHAAATTAEQPLTPAQTTLLQTLLAHQPSTEQPLPDPPPEQVRAALADGVHSLPAWLLQRYAQACLGGTGADGQRAVRLQREFVALSLLRPRPGGPGDPPKPFDDLADALAAEPDARCWVLVGAPGAGKSTLLAHLEARTALDALHALQLDPQARPALALVRRLNLYQADEAGHWPDPAAWLQSQWSAEQAQSEAQGWGWAHLAQRMRLSLLLDGANEITAPTDAERQVALKRWADWALAQAPAPGRAPVFSVRENELAPLQQAGLNPPQLLVQPWHDARIQRYCESQGQAALWPQIQRHPRLMELARNPFNLAAQCQVGQHLGRPAQHRAELLCALLQLRLRQPANQAVLAPLWAGHTLAANWPEVPMALPDPVSTQLARLALAQLRGGHGLAGPVAAWLAAAPGTTRALLDAAQALHLLAHADSADPDEPTQRQVQWRWTHQLWQEFFAARGLLLPDAAPLSAAEMAAPDLPAIDWAAQAQSWQPLARAPVNAWDEGLQLALPQAGKARALDWLAALQAAGNPALAARAAVQDLARLQNWPEAQTALATLQALLRQRSEDDAVDLRLRVEAAELAHELGDERYELREHDRHRYLWPRQWVRVDVGSGFHLGTAGGPPDECGPDGQPVPCTVPPFEMAFAPVTRAEYACFIQDGGYQDPQWWPGPALDWVQGRLDVSRQREAFAKDLARGFPGLAENTWIQPEARATIAKAQAGGPGAIQALINDWVSQAYPAPTAQPVNSPDYWDDARFNHPAQPVVGVSVFEAEAYARWLAARTGQAVRLPTEAEWEAAARGAAGRRWPWGDEPADPASLPRERINHLTTGLFRTSPVGLFRGAATIDGLQDLAGNVWAWCSSAYLADQALNAAICQQPLQNDADQPRVLRGGSWFNLPRHCRAGCRLWDLPTLRFFRLGFRVVICPI